MSMTLHLLGVNGPFPESDGATSGYLLQAGDTLLQLDLGSGVLGRLTARTGPEFLDALFLTHWHFDHASDLMVLIYRLEAAGAMLPLYAPEDPDSALRRIARNASCFQVHDIAPGQTFTVGEAQISVGPARHPVPAVGLKIAWQDRLFGYTGDTNTLPELSDFYQGCNVLLADGLFPEDSWDEGKPHLSARLAAELARDAGVKQLILTHLNPRFSPEKLLSEARTVFPSVRLAEAGARLSL